ncbi:MAG: hypothetical protein ACRC1H_00045 [Caldilineaceae bacterium]
MINPPAEETPEVEPLAGSMAAPLTESGMSAPDGSQRRGTFAWVEQPAALVLILAINTVAYVVGVLGWYGPPLNDPATPIWAWPFVPDCPLFGLLGGLALLQVVAFRRWNGDAQRLTRWVLLGLGAAALAAGLALLLSGGIGAGEMARAKAALFLLAGVSLLLTATLPGSPLWMAGLLAVVLAGQIKYGVWTLTLWGLYWRNTSLLYGAPLFDVQGVVMVVAHVGLIAQGVVLLAWLATALRERQVQIRREVHWARVWGVAALAVLLWFGISDIVDYVLGFHPAVHPLVSLQTMRASTERMTWALTFVFLLLALYASIAAQRGQSADSATAA